VGSGPFGNDHALDFVGDIRDQLVEAVESFARAPEIDHGFDEAFAAIALLDLLASGTPAYRPKPDDDRRWRQAMLHCCDEEIQEMAPEGSEFVTEQRAMLVEQLDSLAAACAAFHT
jgi:Domain of unknown function (DUF4259)